MRGLLLVFLPVLLLAQSQSPLNESPADWWMVKLTGIIACIALVQTIVFGVQALMLKQTIGKMDEIARQQTQDVQASVAEATRAATAMEIVATSMASNVESVRSSVAISREIADTQKLVSELQNRAYLSVYSDAVMPQDADTGFRFEPRVRIENRGHTPARNIRFVMVADVHPYPLRADFLFPLPDHELGESSIIGPGLNKILSAVVPKLYPGVEAAQIESGGGQRIVTWGIVRYQDAFNMERYVRFGFTHYRVGKDQWMSQDTERHNDGN